MTFELADRLKATRPSMIMALVQKAQQLSQSGAPVIDLGIGEPNFKTPEHIKQAAIQAMKDDKTKYTVVPGTVELREAIAQKFIRDNSLDYDISNITVTGGAKQAIYNALMAVLSPGDEVVIPSPFWTSYPDIVNIAQGKPVIVECPQEQRFLISAEQLEEAITPRTRMLMLNSPSNPTGSVYSKEHLAELAQVLQRHPRVLVLSDDIYEHLMFDGHRFCSILDVAPQLKEHVLLINGVSKVFAMTGWRVGYAAGPKPLIAAMNTIQGQSATHACSISQAAAVAALNGPTDFFAERANSFEQRRNIVVDALNQIKGLEVLSPEGAFYVYPRCAGLIGAMTSSGKQLNSDIDICTWLLDEHHVSCVPGAAFGLSPHFRISTAASEATLIEACARIAAAIKTIKVDS